MIFFFPLKVVYRLRASEALLVHFEMPSEESPGRGFVYDLWSSDWNETLTVV